MSRSDSDSADRTNTPSEKPNSSITRRRLLTTAGAIGAVSAIPMIGRAKPDRADRFYENALKKREETGNHGKFTEYLRKHDFQVYSERFQIRKQFGGGSDDSEGDVSAQKLEKDALVRVNLSLANRSSSSPRVNYFFKIYANDACRRICGNGNGEPGPDEICLGWNDDHYRILDNTWYSRDNQHMNFGSSEINGLHYKFNDSAQDTVGGVPPADGSNPRYQSSIGCKIRKLRTNQRRFVRGKYYHTWNSLRLSGFSVGSGGSIGFNFAPKSRSWESGQRTVTE